MAQSEFLTASALVKRASPLAIERRLRVVANRVRTWKRWFDTRHPYGNDIARTLGKGDPVDGPKIGEYIACSALLHLVDGWNYLSRAFDAICHGDHRSAYHLAYYAELRGAISLLAAEGIGVFNNRHIVINEAMQTAEFRRRGKRSRRHGTHKATWLLLSAWSREAGKAERLLQSITVQSRSISDWLSEVGVQEPSRLFVAKAWLTEWSVDLRTMSADPRRRNNVSYRPSRLRKEEFQPLNPRSDMMDPVFACWAELNPRSGWSRAALDISLLRRALDFVVREGVCSYDTFEEVLRALRDELTDDTYQALLTERTSATAIFDAAGVGSIHEKGAISILARSLLILRLATATSAALVNAADLSKEDLEFWWSPLGSDAGLWETPDDYQSFSDLWTDVDDAIETADDLASALQGVGSVYGYSRILSRDIALTQFSRAPLWLLGLD